MTGFMDGGLLVQAAASGLAAGSTYALAGLGFSLIWRLSGVLSFAHGDLAGASVFVAIAVSGSAPGVEGARAIPGSVAALAFGAAAGAALYLFVVRPAVARAAQMGAIAATIAVAFAVQGALNALFTREGYAAADPIAARGLISLGNGATLPVRTLIVLAVGVGVALLASLALRRSLTGSALQAITDEPLAARAAGLPVDRLVAGAFAGAGLLAAIAGVLGAPAGGAVSANTGVLLGLKGIAAALLAGLGAPSRVLIAGLAIGVVEQAVAVLPDPASPLLGAAWRDIVPLALVIGALALRTLRPAVEIVD